MSQNIICPTCRSVLNPVGHVDFNAPSLQVIPCPIEGTPISIPSDQTPGIVPIPYKWDRLTVVTNNYSGIGWKEVTARKAELEKNALYTGQDGNASVYKDFSVADALGESAAYVTEKATSIVTQVGSGVVKGATSGIIGGLNASGMLPIIVIGLGVVTFLYFRGK